MKNFICILILSFTFQLHSQISQLSIKTGANISGRTSTSTGTQGGLQKIGFQLMVEPTICSFGKQSQFDFNTEVSIFEKGFKNKETVYSYSTSGQVNGIGSEVCSYSLYYFTFSPIIKYKFAKIGFIKTGLTGDYLLTAKYTGRPNSEFKSSNRLQLFGAGVNFGGGICVGKKNIKFITEIMGQKDFISSSYRYKNGTKETFRNYSYYVNFGINIQFKKSSE